jgi:hypothetical protein
MFPVYSGKCLPHKAVYNRVEKLPSWSQTFRWWQRGWNGGTQVAKTTVLDFYAVGFWHIGKAMGQVYQCWWRICQEINVFPRFEYHMFYILYPFVTYLLPLPRKRPQCPQSYPGYGDMLYQLLNPCCHSHYLTHGTTPAWYELVPEQAKIFFQLTC